MTGTRRRPSPTAPISSVIASPTSAAGSTPIVPPTATTTIKPKKEYTTEDIITKIKGTIGGEVDKFYDKVQRGVSLNNNETRQLSSYAESTATISREEREQAKMERLDKMTAQEVMVELKRVAVEDFTEEMYEEFISELLSKRPLKKP